MKHVTACGRWLALVLVLACFTGTAFAQRTVTLTLNTATIPDTTRTDSFIEVRGAGDGTAPFTLIDGNVIDWSDVSTLEPVNIGGDYWQIQFQLAETTDLTFKFYSQQAQDVIGEGWEADPNPNIPPGAADTTLPLHYFEAQREYRGVSGDRGEYAWRLFESKEDSVGVWFRVAMFGGESETDEYDPAAEPPAQQIGVRGANLDINGDGSILGPVDWGATNVVLQRESTVEGAPGYNIYSGVAYYPNDLVGQVQPYKFVIDDDVLDNEPLAWEEGNISGDRTFTVPANDTTLHWVYYGDTAPVSTDPVESLVIFNVDLSPFETIGLFDQARGDTLWVFGGFNGWNGCPDSNPDNCLMNKVPGEDRFEAAVPITQIPGTDIVYKYFLDFNDDTFMEAFGVAPPSGWEEAHATGTNRFVEFRGEVEQDLGAQFYNDVTPSNVIPEGTTITVNFEVDMTAALADMADPFDPAGGDSVSIVLGDPVWAFTQGIFANPRGDGDFPNLIDTVVLEDDDGDDVYTGSLTVSGPTYDALTFRFLYGQGLEFNQEVGTDTNEPGRNRVVYLDKNPDGSYLAENTVTATFKLDPGPLPFETNPAFATGIEVVDGEIPDRITLGQNYPNPFNPTTTFTYSLDATQHVTIRVYNLLGQVVATLADGVQAPATYEVTFDAANLASGVYLYRIETATTALSRRMILVK